ncbi:hypothetical protein T03_7024 [Trichinella britovi]|uniref:Uncharacterized protein n=1 Tax=Trichinella britovi TaxID=45882 RepID=A0A0V1AHP2_TRIBR|nr:hypothetical protein T03_7024 [Trichinella britovi]
MLSKRLMILQHNFIRHLYFKLIMELNIDSNDPL